MIEVYSAGVEVHGLNPIAVDVMAEAGIDISGQTLKHVDTVKDIPFVVIEAGYGVMSHSLALVADAGHNFSDVITLLIAWAAMAVTRRSATARHIFGFKKGTILVSLISALFLCAVIGIIIWEAIGRLQTPSRCKAQPLP